MARGDGHHLVDVVHRTAAAEVVHGTCNTLQDGADGLCSAQALHQLVGDVAHLEAGHHEHIGPSGDVTAGSLLGTHTGHQCCVGLQLAVDLQVGVEFASQTCGLDHLVHHFVLGAALGTKAEHGHARIVESGHALRRLRRTYGNLGQLSRIGHRRHRHVANDEHAVLAVLRRLGDE